MPLKDQISSDIKTAMKAKDAAKLSTLRMLQSALTNKEIEAGKALADADVQAVVKSQIKQLKDAADVFEKGGRADMAASSKSEVAVLEAYLPAQMPDEELTKIVKEAVAASGATSKADAGRAMGSAMKAVAGRADGARVKVIVESLLAVLVFALVAGAAHAATPTHKPELQAFVIPALRIARIFLVLLGIVSVTTILHGAFTFMTASGRVEVHHHAKTKMVAGILGSMAIAVVFTVITIFLAYLGG
jgi:hypothetical protein